MQTEPTQTAQIIAGLEDARANGHNWVAFNENRNHAPEWLRYQFFESSVEAQQYCSAWNFPDQVSDAPDYGEVIGWNDEPVFYSFMAIETMLNLLQPDKLRETNADFTVNEIASLMNEQSLSLLPGGEYGQLVSVLQNEEVFPVEWKKTIIPQQEIGTYHVVQHEHQGHQVYEIGHRYRVLESFASFEQARNYMEQGVNLSAAMNERYDYMLIGQYHDKPMIHAFDGELEPNCGLTLMSAHLHYDPDKKSREYTWYNNHPLTDAMQTSQQMFARYNAADNKLHLLNDRLQRTRPEDYMISDYPSNLIYQPVTIKNLSIMDTEKEINTENLEYLKESLKYSGFDTKLNDELEKNIRDGVPEFKLKHETKIGDYEMAYDLLFKQGKKDGMYFFNRMEATLKKPGENEKGITQTFYQNQHISAKEAYNLLNGRAVYTKLSYKNDIKKTYPAWVQLNFSEQDKFGNYEVKKYTDSYNFKVEDCVKELALKEQADPQDIDRMIKSLKRGNLTEANWKHDGMTERVFLAANPEKWNLNAYDGAINKLDINDLKLNAKSNKEDVGEDISGETKKDQKQDQKQEQQQAVTRSNKPKL